VPSVTHLFGKANWWLPRTFDRRRPHLSVEAAKEAEDAMLCGHRHDFAPRRRGWTRETAPRIDRLEVARVTALTRLVPRRNRHPSTTDVPDACLKMPHE